ncbi:hypothetical protein GCM10027511_15470 [Hymenobacter humi]
MRRHPQDGPGQQEVKEKGGKDDQVRELLEDAANDQQAATAWFKAALLVGRSADSAKRAIAG